MTRALELASGQFAVLIDADLRVSWQSDTVPAFLGRDVVGLTALDMLHPDDLELAASGMEHLADRADAFSQTYDPQWRPGTATVRIRHVDGTWPAFDGTAFNFFAEPEIEGLLVVCTPKLHHADLATAIDLLGEAAPLEEVLPVIAEFVDESIASAHTAILWWDGDDMNVVGAGAVDDLPPVPTELVDQARRTGEGQRTIDPERLSAHGVDEGGVLVAMPVKAPGQERVIACVVVWSNRPIERVDRPQRSIYQAVRLVSLAVVDHFAKTALRWEASHDSLTGVLNRAGFEEVVDQRIDGGAMLYLDLDDFKPVNDSIGHAAGDEVLREVARRIQAAVRGDDHVGRIGGDEFAVICPGLDRAGARHVARRLLESIEEPIVLGIGTVSIGVSIGVAMSGRGMGCQELLGRADEALYQAKAQGKSAVALAEAGRTARRDVRA